MRASSYNQFDFCQQQYFLNYVLGIPRSSGKKALKGTVVHKVLECLANIKKDIDNKKSINYVDSELGKLCSINAEELYLKTTLTNEEVDKINNTRLNKDTYKDDCTLVYGHTRYGVSIVEKIIDLAYKYYSDDNWFPVDFKDCTNWVWMVLDYKNGMFDPRNKKIVDVEKKFNITIDRDWSSVTKGKKLSIKGTIDLITEAQEGIIEIVDYKSGQRLDWTSKQDNQIKTYAKLCKDFQLMLYYYAAHYLYPKAKQILVTIFYVRDGGPFTICFDQDTLVKVENRIRSRLEEIQQCELPILHDYSQKHFKCKFICDYYKMKTPGNETNMCLFIHEELKNKGMQEVVKLHTHKGFDIGYYEAPGEI